MMIQSDFHIFFRGVGQPPTSQNNHDMVSPNDVIFISPESNEMRNANRAPKHFREVDLSCESMNRLDLVSCIFLQWNAKKIQKNPLNPRVFYGHFLRINRCFLVHRVDIGWVPYVQNPQVFLGSKMVQQSPVLWNTVKLILSGKRANITMERSIIFNGYIGTSTISMAIFHIYLFCLFTRGYSKSQSVGFNLFRPPPANVQIL